MAESNTTLRRGLAILDALTSNQSLLNGGLTAAELAAEVGADKSQISRSLTVLTELEYVVREPSSRRYRIAWRLQVSIKRTLDALLLREGQLILNKLVERFRRQSYMMVLEGRNAVPIAAAMPHPTIHDPLANGGMPVHYTASGRALIMYDSLEQLKTRMGASELDQPTPGAPATVAELHDRLTDAREVGYVIVDEEMEPGLISVAAPAPSSAGGVRVALSLVGSASTFRDHIDEAGRALVDAAQRLGVA